MLDGEIVCLDPQGRAQFNDLLFRRGEPFFYSFDLLWRNGDDLRYLPLIERKAWLRSIIQPRALRLLYVDHIEQHGDALHRIICEHDLEGIVAKLKYGPYLAGEDVQTSWAKIRNRDYSQIRGREELFNREADRRALKSKSSPLWAGCERAAAATSLY